MKILGFAVAAAALGFGSNAFAQAAAPPATAPTYAERQRGGEREVTFFDDQLYSPAGGAYGAALVVAPRVLRRGLLRPRVDFVSELLVTIEDI